MADGNQGERDARARFSTRSQWSDEGLAAFLRPSLSPGMMRFIEAQPFFFIATADTAGHTDCSFRGRWEDASGVPYPAILAPSPIRLLFPDLAGNNLFQSLGNILETGRIGMLFVDFTLQRRLRVNGTAAVVEGREVTGHWPMASRGVDVTVTEAFPNCDARIPRLVPAPLSEWG